MIVSSVALFHHFTILSRKPVAFVTPSCGLSTDSRNFSLPFSLTLSNSVHCVTNPTILVWAFLASCSCHLILYYASSFSFSKWTQIPLLAVRPFWSGFENVIFLPPDFYFFHFLKWGHTRLAFRRIYYLEQNCQVCYNLASRLTGLLFVLEAQLQYRHSSGLGKWWHSLRSVPSRSWHITS